MLPTLTDELETIAGGFPVLKSLSICGYSLHTEHSADEDEEEDQDDDNASGDEDVEGGEGQAGALQPMGAAGAEAEAETQPVEAQGQLETAPPAVGAAAAGAAETQPAVEAVAAAAEAAGLQPAEAADAVEQATAGEASSPPSSSEVSPEPTARSYLFRPAQLGPLRDTLRVLRLHCTIRDLFTAREAWAEELAALHNLHTLDLAAGLGEESAPRDRALGPPIPWTRRVATAWHGGLTRLEQLSVRLSLCTDEAGETVPLRLHDQPLPVSHRTTRLAVFFDEDRQHLSQAISARLFSAEDYFDAALGVLAAALACCGIGSGGTSVLRPLELSVPALLLYGGIFRFGSREAPAGSAQARLQELLTASPTPAAGTAAAGVMDGGDGAARLLPHLQHLALCVEAACLLNAVLLRPLISSPDWARRRGRITLNVRDRTRSAEALLALHALRGTDVTLRLLSRQTWVAELEFILYNLWDSLEGTPLGVDLPPEGDQEAAKAFVVPACTKLLRQLGRLEVLVCDWDGAPAPSMWRDWPAHSSLMSMLRGTGLTRLGLTFHYGGDGTSVENDYSLGAADMGAHLELVARTCPQLTALELFIYETRSSGDHDDAKRGLAHWRGARAAAAAGSDLERWRPRGCPSPVPGLSCLSKLEALRELRLEFDPRPVGVGGGRGAADVGDDGGEEARADSGQAGRAAAAAAGGYCQRHEGMGGA